MHGTYWLGARKDNHEGVVKKTGDYYRCNTKIYLIAKREIR